MSKLVSVPELGQLSFPDDATSDDIEHSVNQAVMEKQLRDSQAAGDPTSAKILNALGDAPKTIGNAISDVGQDIGDVAKAYAFEAAGDPIDQAKQLGVKAETLNKLGVTKGETDDETDPWEQGRQMLPPVERAAAAGASGLIESAPQMAAFAANPVAGALSFGFNRDGFSPKNAAMAVALPFIGKYTGSVVAAIAQKAGVSSEAALQAFNKLGGAAGAAGAIGADEAHQISQLPKDKQKEAWIDAAGNVGSMFLLGTMGGSEKPVETPANEEINSRNPTVDDTQPAPETPAPSEPQAPEEQVQDQPELPQEAPAPAAEPESAPEEAPVEGANDLPPEQQDLITQNTDAANGAKVRLLSPEEATDDNSPFAGGGRWLAKPDFSKGEVVVNPSEMSRWLDQIPPDKQARAVRSVLSEEGVHLATDAADADTYANNMTGLEKWAVQKRYGSGTDKLSDRNIGYEAIRFQLQQAMHMTPTEYVNAMAGHRSMAALKTLTAVESVSRNIRTKLLKTNASQESLALLDKVQNNINTAKFAMGGGTPAALSGEKAEETAKELEAQAQTYHKLGAHDEADEMLDMARWIRQKGNEQSFPAAMSGELFGDAGKGKKKYENKAEQLARLTGKKPTEGFVSNTNAGRPAAEKVSAFDKTQPVLWTKEGAPITAATGHAPEAVSTKELGLPQVPRTADAIDKAASDIVSTGMERASDAYTPGKVSLGGEVGVPSFEDFSRQMRLRNPELEHDQLLPAFSKALGNALRNTSDNTLMALSKAEFGESEGRPRTFLPAGDETAGAAVPQSPEVAAQAEARLRLEKAVDKLDFGPAKESVGQTANRKFKNSPREVSPAAVARQDDEMMRRIKRNRSMVISSLFKSSVKKAMAQDSGLLHRTSVTPDEIQQGGYNFIDSHGNRIGMPSYQALDANGVGRDTLEALTQKNRRSSRDDWRTTRKVAAIQDKANGTVHLVSVFRHPRGDIRFTDPRVPNSESGIEFGPALFNRYRLLYSALLDEPVRNFHQEFDDLHDYNEKFGNEAQRHTTSGEGRYVETTAADREAEETGFRPSSKFQRSYMPDPTDPRGSIPVWTDPVSGEVIDRDDNPHTVDQAMGWAGNPDEAHPLEYEHIEGLPTTGVNSSSSFMGEHADIVRDRADQARSAYSRGPLSRSQSDALHEYLKSKQKHGVLEAIKQLSATLHPRRRGALTAVVKLSRVLARANPHDSVDELLKKTAARVELANVAAEKPSDFAKLLGVEQPKESISGPPAPPGRELTMPVNRRPPTEGQAIPAQQVNAPRPTPSRYLSPEDIASVMQDVKETSAAEPASSSKAISSAKPAGGPVVTHPKLDFQLQDGQRILTSGSLAARARALGQSGLDLPAAMSGEARDVIESSKNSVLEGLSSYLSARGNKERIPALKDKAQTMAANAGYAAGKSVLMEQVNDHATLARAAGRLVRGDLSGAYQVIRDHLDLKKFNAMQREAALPVLHSGAIKNVYKYSPQALERLSEIRQENPDFKLASLLMKKDLQGVKLELQNRIKENPSGSHAETQMLNEINKLPLAQAGLLDFEGDVIKKPFQSEQYNLGRSLKKMGVGLFKRAMGNVERQLVNEGLLNHKDVKRTFDAKQKNRLDGYLKQLGDAKKNSEQIISRGNLSDTVIQKQRLKEIDRLKSGVEYAKAHWGDDQLTRVATRAKKEFDDQFDREKDAGVGVRYDENFVPGRYDAELFNNGEWSFRPGPKIMGGNTYAAKRFQNHYDAIEAGPYIAATHDLSTLAEHRTRTGANRINNAQFGNSLKSMYDEHVGAPVAVKTKMDSTGKTPIPDPPKGISAAMYKLSTANPDLAVLQGGYSRLVNRMLNPSVFDDSGALSALLAGSQRLKHMALLGDIYHMSKMGLYALASARGNASRMNWRKGLSVLDYREEDLDRAVKSGMIDPRTAAWAQEKIPFNKGGQKLMMSRHGVSQVLQHQGYNVGQIQDAIYKDIVNHVPKALGLIPGVNTEMLNSFQKSTFGRYNKFLFDQWTRGLMGSRGVEEFERLSKLDPGQDSNVVARKVAKDLNTLFGNIGNQGWIQNKTFRDMARFAFLAPQWAEGLVKKDMSVLRLLRAPHTVLSGRESLAGPIGLGFVGMLALTQALNIMQNGHPTWKNQDPDHKMDWQVADNVYVSPLSVYNEMLHDFTRYNETQPTVWHSIEKIGENKLGFPGRAAMVLLKKQNPQGEALTSTGAIARSAAGQLVPLPITAGKPLQAVGHALAPGMVQPLGPGEMMKQALSSAGIKAEFGRKASAQMQDSAQKFMKENNLPTGTMPQTTDEPSYSKLRRSIDLNDTAGAKSMLEELRKTHSDQQILKAMTMWAKHPFTGSKTAERQWLASLSDADINTYQQAIEQKYDLLQKWEEFYQKQ